MAEEITVLRPGLIIESTGAIVLNFKPGTYENTSVVLCVWPHSTYHPFVVWTYNELSGICESGLYEDTLDKAMKNFRDRGW